MCIVRRGSEFIVRRVPAHLGVIGNETANQLAKEAAGGGIPAECRRTI